MIGVVLVMSAAALALGLVAVVTTDAEASADSTTDHHSMDGMATDGPMNGTTKHSMDGMEMPMDGHASGTATTGDMEMPESGSPDPGSDTPTDDSAEMGSGPMGGHGSASANDGLSGHGAGVSSSGIPDATESTGGQLLAPRIDADGALNYELVAKPVRWEILPGVRVTAFTYNGTVPGPQLRVPYGKRVRVVVRNELSEPTSVHWHGLAVPNAMDGVSGVTQDAIAPGQTFTYEFDAIPAGRDSQGGTFFYHSHTMEDRQVGLGMAGSLVIEPPTPTDQYDVEQTLMLGEWLLDPSTGETRPPMQMDGAFPNYFTINGKSFPSTETLSVNRGDRVLLRVIGAGQFNHPMHLHGTDFEVVAIDGHPVEGTPERRDTIDIAPGQRFDLAFTATEPGQWLFHCHIGHHLTNDGNDPGGLITLIDVKP